MIEGDDTKVEWEEGCNRVVEIQDLADLYTYYRIADSQYNDTQSKGDVRIDYLVVIPSFEDEEDKEEEK